MNQNNKLSLKVLSKSGPAFVLYVDENDIELMLRHPNFIKMSDEHNDVFVALDSISAFEILNFRKQPENIKEDASILSDNPAG